MFSKRTGYFFETNYFIEWNIHQSFLYCYLDESVLNTIEGPKQISSFMFCVRLVNVLQKGGCRGGLSPEKQPIDSIR